MASNLSLPQGFSFDRLAAPSFEELVQQWTDECASLGEDFSLFASPAIEHARKICAETPDPKYGIFGVRHDGKHEVIVHINRAQLPGTTGYTLRVLWALAAPRYDFSAINPDELGATVAALFTGIVGSAQGDLPSRYIKVHLGSMPDRSIFGGMAHLLLNTGIATEVASRGNWLHLTLS